MTYLTRLAKLGMAKEGTPGVYTVPTVSVPWTTAKYVDVIEPLIDESVRSDDVVVHTITQGAANSTWELDFNAYPDFIGHLFAGMGLFDTVTPGVSTTLASGTTAGTTNSLSLAASVPNNSILEVVDSGGGQLEYLQVGTISGTGPYTAPITTAAGAGNTTLYTHASGGTVLSQSTHLFKQNRTFSTVWPTYSFTTNEGVDAALGWAGCTMNELAVKIDPKTFVTMSPKYAGFRSAAQTDFTYAASTVQPFSGFQWSVTNGGATSNRGLSMDFTFKRAQELIHASTGLQSPREIFQGALEVDGGYKAIFENDSDVSLFRNNTQQPTVHTLTQPVLFGGAVLVITMSQSGYVTGEVNTGGVYVQLDLSVKGIKNTTDAGLVQISLKNFQVSAY